MIKISKVSQLLRLRYRGKILVLLKISKKYIFCDNYWTRPWGMSRAKGFCLFADFHYTENVSQVYLFDNMYFSHYFIGQSGCLVDPQFATHCHADYLIIWHLNLNLNRNAEPPFAEIFNRLVNKLIILIVSLGAFSSRGIYHNFFWLHLTVIHRWINIDTYLCGNYVKVSIVKVVKITIIWKYSKYKSKYII